MRDVTVDLNFLLQWRSLFRLLRDVCQRSGNDEASLLLEKFLARFEKELARITAMAWAVIIIDAKSKIRMILPVSDVAAPSRKVRGMIWVLRYMGMEGRNGGAAIQNHAEEGRCFHTELEIDGAEKTVTGLRVRIFQEKEDAEAWSEEVLKAA